ncbi:MAG: hypothetical protein WCW65_03325 [Candidatus Paceibacterota bacterium]
MAIKPDFKAIFLDIYRNYKGPRAVLVFDDFFTMEIVKEDGTPIAIGLKNDLNLLRVYNIDIAYENLKDKNRLKKLFTIRILGSKGLYPKLSFKFH